MVLFKFIDRCTGIVSTLILARLLLPEDFGLIALANTVIAMLEILGAFGLETALVQRTDATRDDFDSVWTFNVFFGLSLGLIVGGLAWPTAQFYNDPRLVSVMLFLGLRQAVHGFENVGIISFRKELQFDREFKFLVLTRLTTTLVFTIPLALVLRNYWALLAGTLAGTCISVILSYLFHPYRPQPSFAALGRLMTFSKWLLFTSFIEFIYSRAAHLIVGRWAGPAALGSLSLASEIASVATRELAAPINRAVFPGYAHLKSDPAELGRSYIKVTSAVILLVMPAGVGLCLLAEPIVVSLLGDRWREAVDVIRVLALNGVLTVFLSTAHHLNLAAGMSRSTSMVLAAHAGITIPLMLWLVPTRGSYGAAISMLIASIMTAPFNFYLLSKAIRFGFRDLLTLLFRPAVGSLLMAGALLTVQFHWPTPVILSGQLIYIVVLSLMGAALYAGVVFLIWYKQKPTDSAEAWFLEKARCLLLDRRLSRPPPPKANR